MIITTTKPFTSEEITHTSECYEVYIKTVIDLEKKICSAGAEMHVDSEKILLEQGSKQENVWGGGIDLDTKIISFNSFINIRPGINQSNELTDTKLRSQFESLMKYFFKVVYE